MKESDYIITTNRVKISMALTIMRDVLPSCNYGVSEDEYDDLMKKLIMIERNLFSLTKCEED